MPSWFPLGAVVPFVLALLVPVAKAQPSDLPVRGRYLGEVAASCGACHNAFGPGLRPVAGMELAGGRVFEERGFRAVVPNITQDEETGIGAWSDAQIAASIRDGHRPDGSLIGPPMPVESYRGISDRDLAALVAWLRSVQPVRNAVTEPSRYPFALSPHGPPVASVPDPAPDDPVARGRYLAVNIAHCMDCHSPSFRKGARTRTGVVRRDWCWKAPGVRSRPATSAAIRKVASAAGRMNRSWVPSRGGSPPMGAASPRRWGTRTGLVADGAAGSA